MAIFATFCHLGHYWSLSVTTGHYSTILAIFIFLSLLINLDTTGHFWHYSSLLDTWSFWTFTWFRSWFR